MVSCIGQYYFFLLFIGLFVNAYFQKSVFVYISDYLFPATAANLCTVESLLGPLICVINGSGVKHVSEDIEKSH